MTNRRPSSKAIPNGSNSKHETSFRQLESYSDAPHPPHRRVEHLARVRHHSLLLVYGPPICGDMAGAAALAISRSAYELGADDGSGWPDNPSLALRAALCDTCVMVGCSGAICNRH